MENQLQNVSKSKITVKPKSVQQQPNPRFIVNDKSLSPIHRVVEVMMVVNTQGKEAQLNATSIPDNNGGRIQLNDPTVPKPDFTKVVPNK